MESSLTKNCASPLDIQKVLKLFEGDGPIHKNLKHFERREEQLEMLKNLLSAFNENAVALIEAGTGTGKSMAYLIPALLAGAIWHERVVISTQTISLQEQLLKKDLPLLMKSLGIDLKAVLVKGMGNYICLRKLDEMEYEKALLSPQDQETLSQIEFLSRSKGCGSRSELPFNPAGALWEMVSADFDTCNGADCPHYQECHYIQARKNAQDAQIVIVNHHLLLGDLIARAETENYSSPALLPPYTRLIVDEAHNLEEIASDYFATKISRLELLKILAKISSEKQGQMSGKLSFLKERLSKKSMADFSRAASGLFTQLTVDLPAMKRDLLKEISDVFQVLEQFQRLHGVENSDEQKLRLKSHHYKSQAWQEGVSKKMGVLCDLLKRYANELKRLEETSKDVFDERNQESLKGAISDIKSLANKLNGEACSLELFIKAPDAAGSIRWLETMMTKGGLNLSLVDAALNISKLLFKYLFEPFDTVALLSATLTTQNSFSYIKDRMGLSGVSLGGRKLIEATYPSPFDYDKQALLVIPKDIHEPSHPDFLKEAIHLIHEAILASRGNAFILFTSYGMLRACYDLLEAKLKEARFFPLKQGDEGRNALLARFMNQDRSILFGTDSFWEGIDVVGEALRLVVIAKLPFKVPTDPMIEARSEAIRENGGDPFYEILLPQAAIKLKQGFGRLIRNKKDRGCIVCLDNRLIHKSYGKYLLKSLPSCPKLIVEGASLKEEMAAFYKKTHYLTRS